MRVQLNGRAEVSAESSSCEVVIHSRLIIGQKRVSVFRRFKSYLLDSADNNFFNWLGFESLCPRHKY